MTYIRAEAVVEVALGSKFCYLSLPSGHSTAWRGAGGTEEKKVEELKGSKNEAKRQRMASRSKSSEECLNAGRRTKATIAGFQMREIELGVSCQLYHNRLKL